MHFLYIHVKDSSYDILWTLLEMNESVSMYEESEFDPNHPIPEEFQKLDHFLCSNDFNCLISYLYIPEVSELCKKYGYKYIGWVYDSPLVSLFHPSVRNSCNYLFIFDRAEYEYMLTWKIPHLYYLPMATNISRTGALDITLQDEQNFTCDISFVGSLYEDNLYNKLIHTFPEDIANELKLYLVHNLCCWSKTKPWPIVSQKIKNYMIQNFQANDWDCGPMDLELYLGILLLSRKLAEMDRITVLNTLSQKFSLHLYTNSDDSIQNYLQNVQIHSGVNYTTDMNKVFYLSKINLNITLPSIETGLPQRIFDIMGAGGFVLTNYQQEIDDYFTVGKNIEVFHDLDELTEKTSYYLTHEQERLKIALNGYQKVREQFSYDRQIKKILHIVREENH